MKSGHPLKNSAPLILLAVFSLFFSACMGPVQQGPTTVYYTLDYNSPNLEKLPPVEAYILVDNFSIAPTYNSNRIIYSEGDFMRDTYEYHQWRANPANMITFFLTRDLREAGLFQGVFSKGSRVRPSHTLEGVVSQIYEKDDVENWQAVLSIDLTLLQNYSDKHNQAVLFQKNYTAIKDCAKKNPAAFVEAMSAAMREISEKISLDIYHGVKVKG